MPVIHVPQRQHGDCLVACADMVLAYLGRPISYSRLERTLRVLPGVGAPFSNLRFLERLKIAVIYDAQGTLTRLERFLSNGWPCIVPVKARELPYWGNLDIDHAIVVVGMDAASIYLNDPAFVTAPVQVSRGDFDLAWFERGANYVVLAP